MNSLMEGSQCYHSKSDVYEIFSRAEDFNGKIFEFLKPRLKDKTVLDIGCGNGKYLCEIAKVAKNVIGIENAVAQVQLAQKNTQKLKNVRVIEGFAQNLPFIQASFEVVFASWFLGVIKDWEVKEQIVGEMKRVLKPNGSIILVENDCGGEFETIRGRIVDGTNPTKQYNEWLLNKLGFKVLKRLKTCFRFTSEVEAKHVFNSIWGDKAGLQVHSQIIEHNVIIFEQP